MLCCVHGCKSELNYDKRLPDGVLKQPLWYDKNLKYKGKPIFFENWEISGILYVIDLFDDGILKLLEHYSNIIDKSKWLFEYKIINTITRKKSRTALFPNSSCGNKMSLTLTSIPIPIYFKNQVIFFLLAFG